VLTADDSLDLSAGSAWPRRSTTRTGPPDDRIRRGIFHSVPDLIDAIETYLATHNQNPEPFRWTATTDKILEKVRRGRITLDAITN
jgi:hypothetical protein